MDFELTDEQKDIKKAARDFAEGEFEDVARDLDREEKFPEDIWKKACELGFIGAHIPEEYGGMGLGWLGEGLIMEEFWRVDPGCGQILATTFGCEMLMLSGSEEQKKKWLPPLTKGEAIMAGAITEPDTGTDVASVKTRAEKDGDEYVINGSKMFITNGTIADYMAVLCVTNPEEEKTHQRQSVIMVETDRDGFEAEKLDGKLGIRASPTAEITFDNVRVPKENLVGEEGKGFYQFMNFFNVTRLGIAAQAVGLMQGSLELALDYAKERETFGRPLTSNQGIRWYLVDMLTFTETARSLYYRAASQADKGDVDPGLIAMAKKYAAENAVKVVDKALQIHGGYGYIDEYKIERFYRDAKILEIYEGTTEAENMTIATFGLGI